MVLALGGLTLLEGCAHNRTVAPHASPTRSEFPEDSHPEPSLPSPSATASPTPWPIPTPNTPVPGLCPTVPGLSQTPGGPQHYLPCSGTDIALTIDDGPDPEFTPKILGLLARYGIPATFCMIGRHAAANHGLVARVADAGHQVANHTFTHPLNLPRLTPPQITSEIHQATDAITAASGGHRPTLFRAPGGNWSATVIATCTAAGMRPLDWSVDPRDWSLPGVPHIVQVILTRTHPGSIILDHDGGGNRQQTVDALAIAQPRLLDAGYHFTQP